MIRYTLDGISKVLYLNLCVSTNDYKNKRTTLSYRSFFISSINFVKSFKSSAVAFNLMKLLAVDRLLRYVLWDLFFSLYRLSASACCSGVEYAFLLSVTTSPPFTYHSISDLIFVYFDNFSKYHIYNLSKCFELIIKVVYYFIFVCHFSYIACYPFCWNYFWMVSTSFNSIFVFKSNVSCPRI